MKKPADAPLYERAQTTLQSIESRLAAAPDVAIILGTGLGALAQSVENKTIFPYSELSGFPVSTVESHKGRLVFGTLSGRNVVVLQGRFHKYEGYSLQDVTFPIRVLKLMGVRTLFVSNACGTVNPMFEAGDLMLIDDHINLLGDNPLIGWNDERFGPRFPDMSEPYSKHLLELAETVALELQLKVHRGVYAAVTGPCLETRAEYRYMRTIGADVIGMSTVPENIVARHMNMDVLGISIITDECFPDSLKPLSLEDVIGAASKAEPKFAELVKGVIGKLASVVLVLLSLVGCSPDNPTINSFNDNWRLLVSNQQGVGTIEMPSGENQNLSVWRPSKPGELYPVASIKDFRDRIYLLTKSEPMIVVLDRSTLNAIDSIDCSGFGPVNDVAFANATTAYATFKGTNKVGVVDLTINAIASTIDVPGEAYGIAVIGNQLCAALGMLNQVAIIDSRTNRVEITIDVPAQVPYFVAGDVNAQVFCVVSVGAGKIPSDERETTTPVLSFVDVVRRVVLKSVDLTARASEGPSQIVRGIAVNSNMFSYTPVQGGLLRSSNSARNKASALQYNDYHIVSYNAARAEIICVYADGRTVDVFEEYGDELRKTVVLSDSVSAVLGIAP